jgi:hypothetical protein
VRLRGDVRTQMCGRFANGDDVRRRPRHAGRMGEFRAAAVEQRGDVRIVAASSTERYSSACSRRFGRVAPSHRCSASRQSSR